MNAKEFILKFQNTFRQNHSRSYATVWAKEGRIMSLLSKKLDDDILLLRAIETFLNYPPEFWGVNQHSIFMLSKSINSVLQVIENQKKPHPHVGRFSNAKDL